MKPLIYVVGFGPGDRPYMTQQAIDAVTQADLVVGYTTYIRLLEEQFPELRYYATPMRKETDRCRAAVEAALTGKTVALVSSGDSGIYGMAGVLLEIAAEMQADVEIIAVPGVTAASAAAAVLGAPLMHDFAGDRGEEIRQILLNVPKYGNDDDFVDGLVVRGYDTYLDEIKKYKNTRYGRGPIGGHFYAGTSSVAANVPQGAGTCATPDGRHAGEPLAEGCSPTHSMDTHGPTSVFKSVSKLRTQKIAGGVLLNQKVNPQMLAEPKDCKKLSFLLRTFFDTLQGFHVQYNVVSRETLLDAQKHPENYRDLIVRVAGYSAFFTVLSPQTQNDIIARTEQIL